MNITKRSRNNLGGAVLAASLVFGGSGMAAAQSGNFPFRPGETVHYTIKKLNVKAGEATLTFNGLEKFAGQDVLRITFKAASFNFYDEERIFIDPKTFFPLRVERDLNIFGKKEKIWEIYDHVGGEIRIVKFVKGKEVKQTIKKDGRVDNIYCFLYRFRGEPSVKPGSAFKMALPTRDVTIDYLKQSDLKIGRDVYRAMYLQSNPKEYKIWFEDSARRLPLRIDGAMGIASTSLVMTEYKP